MGERKARFLQHEQSEWHIENIQIMAPPVAKRPKSAKSLDQSPITYVCTTALLMALSAAGTVTQCHSSHSGPTHQTLSQESEASECVCGPRRVRAAARHCWAAPLSHAHSSRPTRYPARLGPPRRSDRELRQVERFECCRQRLECHDKVCSAAAGTTGQPPQQRSSQRGSATTNEQVPARAVCFVFELPRHLGKILDRVLSWPFSYLTAALEM